MSGNEKSDKTDGVSPGCRLMFMDKSSQNTILL